MTTSRERLHLLVDALPEDSLCFAEKGLEQWLVPWSDRGFAGASAQIDHVAAWVSDLQRARAFYERWFQAKSGPMYSSTQRKFESFFLTLGHGARLELMKSPGEPARPAHVAISVGSLEAVGDLFEQMRSGGVLIVREPRQTGDGYYEMVVKDSEGNLTEITV